MVVKVVGGQYGPGPVLLWDLHIEKQAACYFKEEVVQSLSEAILSRCIGFYKPEFDAFWLAPVVSQS